MGIVRPDVVKELRQMAAEGSRPSELLAWIGNRHECGGQNYKLLAIQYFREAFGLPLDQAVTVTAWAGFPGSAWTDEMLDEDLGPRIRPPSAAPR